MVSAQNEAFEESQEPLENSIPDEAFISHEDVMRRYPKTGENRFAVEPILKKARTIFRNFGYKNIKRIRVYESDSDIQILYVRPESNTEAIVGCMCPDLHVVFMSKPHTGLTVLYL